MVLPRASLSSLRCLTRGAAIASVGRSTNSTATSSTRALSIVSHYNHHKNESVTPSTAPLPSSFSVLTSGMSLLSLQKPPPVASSSSIISHRPFSSQQQQYQPPEPITILTLSNLTDNPGAITRARRIGRGIGSSKGKTSGRGHKGQKARAGKGVHPTFEGGQTKFYKRMPKIGKMKNANFKLQLIPLNIGRVQEYVTMGRLIAERSDGVLTMRDFVKAGMFPASAVKSGVKLLGGGKGFVKDELFLEVPWASASAIEAVEKAGGYVTTVHHNRLALRALLKPHKFPAKPEAAVGGEGAAAAGVGAASSSSKGEVDVEDMHLLPKRARPPPKFMQYYTDYSKRGYLNPRVQLERKQRGLKEVH